MTSQSRAWEWGEKRDFKKYSTSVQFQFIGRQSRVLLSHVHLISSRVWKRWMLHLFTRHGSHRGQPSNLQSWQPIYDMAVCQNFSWLERKSAANKYQEGPSLVAVFWRMKNIPSDKWRAEKQRHTDCTLSLSWKLPPRTLSLRTEGAQDETAIKMIRGKKQKKTKTTKPLYVTKVM